MLEDINYVQMISYHKGIFYWLSALEDKRKQLKAANWNQASGTSCKLYYFFISIFISIFIFIVVENILYTCAHVILVACISLMYAGKIFSSYFSILSSPKSNMFDSLPEYSLRQFLEKKTIKSLPVAPCLISKFVY